MRLTKQFLEDLLAAASAMQNAPERFDRVFIDDKRTRQEMGHLVDDLLSLVESIESEDNA